MLILMTLYVYFVEKFNINFYSVFPEEHPISVTVDLIKAEIVSLFHEVQNLLRLLSTSRLGT